jgi:hypothetical protein
VLAQYERGVGRDPGVLERGPVAVQAGLVAARPRWPPDVADAPVPEREQVLGGGQPAGEVRGPDAADLDAGQAHRVEHDERQPGPGERVDVCGGERPGDDHDPGAAAVGEPARPRRRRARGEVVVVDLADDDRGTHLRACVHDAFEHLRGVGAEPAVDDQFDGQVRARLPAGGGRDVPVLAQQFLDERPGVGGDVVAAVDDLGHGGDRYAGRRGDRRESGAPGLPPAGGHL